MHFLIAAFAAAATVGLANAAPAPAASAEASGTYYVIEGFYASFTPAQNSVDYDFDVIGHSENNFRKFGYAHCQLDLTGDGFTPVQIATCQNAAQVYFGLTEYKEDGEFAGYRLTVSHPYHTSNGLCVDGIGHKFPKSLIEEKGRGRNKRQQIYVKSKITVPLGGQSCTG